MDNAQFIALLKDLGVPTGRLERHFFEGHTSTSLAETIVDNNSALGMSMERLGGLKDRHGTAPAITASAPPRWRIVGQGMGGGVAAYAAASDPQFGASLDAIVLFEPHAFALLSRSLLGGGAISSRRRKPFNRRQCYARRPVRLVVGA